MFNDLPVLHITFKKDKKKAFTFNLALKYNYSILCKQAS